MKLELTVIADSVEKEKKWKKELSSALEGLLANFQVSLYSQDQKLTQMVFVDASAEKLGLSIEKMERMGRAIFLIVSEQSELPHALLDGKVDDLIVAPFRPLELLSKIRHVEQILMWKEMTQMSSSFSDSLMKLNEDIHLAARLQKANFPKRFDGLESLEVKSRYLAGLKSGGDYFDLAESKDKQLVSLILSTSSSYKLSSALLPAFMRVVLKLSVDGLAEPGAVSEVVKQIHEEILVTLKEKDRLSLFYATFCRKTQMLRFLNLGETLCFYSSSADAFALLPSQGGEISQATEFHQMVEGAIQLFAQDRLAIVSHGLVQEIGNPEMISRILMQNREKQAMDSLNEFAFKVKSKLSSEEMPSRDCTAVIIDILSDIKP